MHTSALVDLDYIESVFTPVKHFSEWLNYIISAHDTDATLNAPERFLAKPLADNGQTFLSLHGL